MNQAEKDRGGVMMPMIFACIIVLLASLPYLVGMFSRPEGAVFTGFTYNIDDACVYSSWVRQIADGSVLIRNQYASEPQSAFQFNLLFLILGVISRVTQLSPAAVLHLARVVSGIGLLMLVWRFSIRFLKDPLERSLIVPMVGLSSGLGWMLVGIEGHRGPVDMWQPEAITFLSIYLNPLFLAGMILMLASLDFLYRMKTTGSWRDAVFAGLMLLLLANIHTYDVLTVGAVWTAYLVVKSIRMRRVPWDIVGRSAVAAAISLPAIAYQFYLYSTESVFRMRVESAAPSPALWAYLMGFGLVLVLVVLGAMMALKERRGMLMLVVWSIVGFAMPYVPVAQQRKLVMGLHIPLAILATVALAWLVTQTSKRLPGIRSAAVLISVTLIAVLAISNLAFIDRDIRLLKEGITAPMYPAYLADSEMAALRWLRANTDRSDIVLGFRETVLFVPAVAGNRVYYGHWSETPDFGRKLNEWFTFASASTPDDWRREFLRATGARYIIYPSNVEGLSIPIEGSELPIFDLRSASYARPVFGHGDLAVFRIEL